MKPRRLLTVAGFALAALILVGQVRHLLDDPTVWPPDDFVEYWAAAKLTLDGRNPYAPEQLLPLQQAAGRDTDEAIMMWNPPWSLAVVLPLGLLPARAAQLLWLAANLAAVGFCGHRLWAMFGGNRERRWLGWVVAIAFVPTLFALQSGQIGPLLLLGAVLFLECQRRGWHVLAGAATVLLAVKPHLAYLVWAAILCEAVARRRFSTLIGGTVAGAVCTLIPLAFDPQLLHQYADAMSNRPPSRWLSPTLGSLLRLAFGEERFGLQFVSVGIGAVWFALHWRKWRHAWNWTEQLPLLLLVSFVTAPYGAWPFDLVLLLPAVVRLVASWRAGSRERPMFLPRGAHATPLTALLLINLACLLMNVLGTGSFAFIWVAPALLAVYVAGTRATVPHAKAAPAAVPA